MLEIVLGTDQAIVDFVNECLKKVENRVWLLTKRGIHAILEGF